MVICQAPVMPVVVWKRLPVSVFWAVTVTPGRGMLPLLTTPCSFPPVTTGTEEAGTCVAGACGAGALVAGGGATGGVAGDCASAERPPTTRTPAATAYRTNSRRICAPC